MCNTRHNIFIYQNNFTDFKVFWQIDKTMHPTVYCFFLTICPHKVKILVKTLPQTTLCFIFLGKTMSNGWLNRIGKSKSYVLIVLSLCKTKFTRIAVCWYMIVWLGKNCQRCKYMMYNKIAMATQIMKNCNFVFSYKMDRRGKYF